MNRENIQKVRDHIVAVDATRFDMTVWCRKAGGVAHDIEPAELVHNCNTAGCIGGWAEGLLRKGRDDGTSAQDLLGLDEDQAYELFYAWDGPGLDKITQAQAAMVLNHLLATGNVDWYAALADSEASSGQTPGGPQ